MLGIELLIQEIRQGNESIREEFIASHKPFIHRYASFICNRGLDWGSDDELSIALIAFNNAIDKFETSRGSNFSAYARASIKNSLIDYFRSQPEFQKLPLETKSENGDQIDLVESVSFELYQQEMENRERAFELQLFIEELSAFGINLADLPASSPSHRDTRKYLQSTARKICRNEEIVKKILRDKRLPLKEIQAYTGASRKILEKWRRYLVALIKEMVWINNLQELLNRHRRRVFQQRMAFLSRDHIFHLFAQKEGVKRYFHLLCLGGLIHPGNENF